MAELALELVTGSPQWGKRHKDDYYPTPPKAILALLEREDFPGVVWEPCCGCGAIARFFPQESVMASDLFDHGYGEAGIDFLLEHRMVDHVVTNPPFKLAFEFVKHALDCSTGKVAMLLRLAFLEAQSRQEFFKTSGLARVYVFSKRLRFACGRLVDLKEDVHSNTSYAWFVWEKGYPDEPVIRWI